MKGGPNPSLQTVIDLIAANSSLPAWRRAGLKCGVAQIARGLRRRAEELPADWGLLRTSIEKIDVADMGWSRRTAANHRANCRKAIEIAIPTRASGVGRLALTDAWRLLWDQVLDENHRRRLSVGVRFFSAMGLGPAVIDEPALDLLMAHRKSGTPHAYALSDRRRFAQAWNDCAERIAGWPAQRLEIPPDGRFRGARFRDFPETLQREIDNYFASRAVSRSLSTLNVRTYGARTAGTRRRELVAFAARAAELRSVSELGSLKALLDPDLVVGVLEAYWSDDGEEPSTYTIDLAWRLYLIARESACLDGDKLQQLAEIKSKLQKRRRHGITEKNRKLIRAIRSTDIWSKVCKLPYDLMAEARREHNKNPKKAALKAQTAVAIAILTYAPVRVGNLSNTRIGEHLNRVGGPKGVLFLVYRAQEVKNHVDLEFELGGNLDALISE
ncbi:MAG: hypothetical protein ABW003_05165 [Microvirga sp.]